MDRLTKSDAEWHALLTSTQFSVLRKGEMERRGSHALIHERGTGLYICAGCFNPLFESSAKFANGDFPSFYEAIPGQLALRPDFGGFQRMAYSCARCGGFQGLVYNDGPQPTGKRYSNSGEALMFVPRGQRPPPPRL